MRGIGTGFFTLRLEEPVPDGRIHEALSVYSALLEACAPKYRCRVAAYCFMPDHGHLLVEGRDERSDMWLAIVKFKQATASWQKVNRGAGRWQRGFDARIVRPGDEVRRIVEYIVNNPVRSGLVRDWRDYAFSGCVDAG